MTKAQLITDMKNLIGPAGKGSEVGDVGIGYWINEAYMIVVGKIINTIPDYFNKRITTASIAGQDEYDLPDDFEKMVFCSVTYDGSTWVRALPLNNIGQATTVFENNSSDFDESQPFYYLTAGNIGILPAFSSTTSSAIKIWYSSIPDELDNDEDVPEIPKRLQYQLKYLAYANYLDQDDQHAAAERMRQRFDVNTELIIGQMAERQVDQPKTVEVMGGDDLYADQWI